MLIDFSLWIRSIACANNDDTVFVYSGFYREIINVGKSISMIGEDKNNTIINGRKWSIEDDVIYVDSDNVLISGFTIQNSGNGIYVGRPPTINTVSGIDIRSKNNTIKNNIIKNNCRGIFVEN